MTKSAPETSQPDDLRSQPRDPRGQPQDRPNDPGHPHDLPRFRPARSSLAVGRRFRLLAKGPLLGAGVRPRVPNGFRAIGRDPEAREGPESPYEKQLVVPLVGNNKARDLLWAEGRFATDVAVEDSLVFAMLLPTETAPDRKQEAQRLHERALKLYQRVDALGPSGMGDPRGFAEDLRSGLQPLLDFEETTGMAQERGQLHGLAVPSHFRHARRNLVARLDRMDAIATGDLLPSAHEVASLGCGLLAEEAHFTAHALDPSERARIQEAAYIAQRLEGAAAPMAETRGVEPVVQASIGFHTEVARGVEQATIQSALGPIRADGMRRLAVKVLDDLQRSLAAEAMD